MRLLLALALLAFLAAPAAATLDAVHNVALKNTRFNPNVLFIKAGDTVVWTNQDNFLHTVTAFEDSFDSGILAPGATFTWTSTGPGVIPYHCNFHGLMVAVLVVQA